MQCTTLAPASIDASATPYARSGSMRSCAVLWSERRVRKPPETTLAFSDETENLSVVRIFVRDRNFLKQRLVPFDHSRAMLRSFALSCVDRRSKPVKESVGESPEEVLEDEVAMKDGEFVSNDGLTRAGKVKLNVKNVMKTHLQGTKRVRTCLLLTPIVMLLVMFTRPLYAPLIDVFGPTEEELKLRARSAAAATARSRFEKPRIAETGAETGSSSAAQKSARKLFAERAPDAARQDDSEVPWNEPDPRWTDASER